METSGQLHAFVVLPPRKTAAGTHWVAPRTNLGALDIIKTLHLPRTEPQFHCCPLRRPVTSQSEVSRKQITYINTGFDPLRFRCT